MRQATEHPAPPTPESKRTLRPGRIRPQAAVKADQERIDQLQKQLASAKDDRKDSLQQQIDLTKAQLELDQDESGRR